MSSIDITYIVGNGMMLFMWIMVLVTAFITICKFIEGIVKFKNPEYYCKNCGRKVDMHKKKCPKCKVKLR